MFSDKSELQIVAGVGLSSIALAKEDDPGPDSPRQATAKPLNRRN